MVENMLRETEDITIGRSAVIEPLEDRLLFDTTVLAPTPTTTAPTAAVRVDLRTTARTGGTTSKLLSAPLYKWWYGCAPTAAGVIMGYWDARGFPNLVPGDAQTMTQGVKDMIADAPHIISGQENQPRNPMLPPDYTGLKTYFGNGDYHNSPSYPNHEQNRRSLADMMSTVDGITYETEVIRGTQRYLQSRGATGWTLWEEDWGQFTFQDLKWSIDQGFPMLVQADTDANGLRDHATPAVGYNEATNQYAIVDTVKQEVRWYDFAPVLEGRAYGVARGMFILPPAPELNITRISSPVKEGRWLRYRVTRTGGPLTPLTVKLQFYGTATAGKDYYRIPNTITIPEGKSYVTIVIKTRTDSIREKSESVWVGINENSSTYWVGAQGWAKGVIEDVPPVTA